jgi:hypothetical protein
VLFNQLLQSGWIGTHETVHNLPSLDKDKRGHGRDIVLGRGCVLFTQYALQYTANPTTKANREQEMSVPCAEREFAESTHSVRVYVLSGFSSTSTLMNTTSVMDSESSANCSFFFGARQKSTQDPKT